MFIVLDKQCHIIDFYYTCSKCQTKVEDIVQFFVKCHVCTASWIQVIAQFSLLMHKMLSNFKMLTRSTCKTSLIVQSKASELNEWRLKMFNAVAKYIKETGSFLRFLSAWLIRFGSGGFFFSSHLVDEPLPFCDRKHSEQVLRRHFTAICLISIWEKMVLAFCMYFVRTYKYCKSIVLT